MNKSNSYIEKQRTKEQSKKEIKTKYIKLINTKNIKTPQLNIENLQIIFPHMNINKRKINAMNNKKENNKTNFGVNGEINTQDGLKKENLYSSTLNMQCSEITDDNVSVISLYDGTRKKINIHKFNSITYVKKRPNDLIKNQNLNRSTISKYSNQSIKLNLFRDFIIN